MKTNRGKNSQALNTLRTRVDPFPWVFNIFTTPLVDEQFGEIADACCWFALLIPGNDDGIYRMRQADTNHAIESQS